MTDHVGNEDDLYANRPSDISWKGWLAIIKRAALRSLDMSVSVGSAGVAFFGFISLFPLVAAAVILFGIFVVPEDIAEQVAMLESFAPQSAIDIIRGRLEVLAQQPSSGLGLGLAFTLGLALWGGSRGVNALMHMIDIAYREENERSFIKNAILSIGMTIGALIFLVIALGLVAILPGILNIVSLGADTEALTSLLRWPILAALVFLMFAALLRQAPDRSSAKIRWLWPGALSATLIWLSLSVGFSFYVENFANYGATFGALSSAVVLMLWLYYSAMAVTFSAMINAEAELETKRDTTSGVNKPLGERGAFVADNHVPLKAE